MTKITLKRKRRTVHINRAANALGSLLTFRCEFTEQVTARKAQLYLNYLMRLASKAP